MGGWGLALALAGLLCAAVALASGDNGAAPASAEPTLCSHAAPRGISAERWSAARRELAPASASEIRLCRYSGLNDHPPLRLVRSRLLSHNRLVAQLVKRLNGLPSGPRGAVSCPTDDGSQILVLVAYPGGREVRISVGLRGCELVSNGSVHRTASGYGPRPRRGPRLLAELERLVGGGQSANNVAPGLGRWTVLARSPLHWRSEATVVWDGHEVLELGGVAAIGRGSVPRNAGAAYDPATGRWRRVAHAPSAELPADNTGVWTGREVFVFSDAPGRESTNVGALYDPATNRWRVTRRAPVGPFYQDTVAWTGRRVILAGLTPGNRSRLEVASYDPATSRWARMQAPISRRHPPLGFAMVRTNRGVLLWSLWSRTRQISRNAYAVYSGVDVYRLRPGGRWSNVTGHWPQHQTVDDPVFTGSRVLLPPGQIWCGACSHPAPVDAHGYIVDPRTLHLTQIPHGPLDDLGPQILWTGQVELSLNSAGEISGPGVHVQPGDIAAWNPRTSSWARGPRAPMHPADMPAVWTGKRLLVLAEDGHLLAYAP